MRACARAAALVTVAAAASSGVLAGGAQAQAVPGRPAVEVSMEHAGGGAVLRLQVPDGWAMYAPDSPVGLPLEVVWRADGKRVEASAAWPESEREPTALGEARVFRGPVVVRVGEPLPGRLTVRVRWAVCRADLCVPGTSEAALPRFPPGGTPQPGGQGAGVSGDSGAR